MTSYRGLRLRLSDMWAELDALGAHVDRWPLDKVSPRQLRCLCAEARERIRALTSPEGLNRLAINDSNSRSAA